MPEALERVTLENAAEQLKAKIRTAFVELLPEEQWKEMVAAELKRFTTPTQEKSYGMTNAIVTPSAFSKICNDVLAEYVKTEMVALLQGPEWRGQWGQDGHEMISVAIKSWLTENSQALIESTVQALAGGAAQRIIQMMRP